MRADKRKIERARGGGEEEKLAKGGLVSEAGRGEAERENFGYNKIQISARTNSPYREI